MSVRPRVRALLIATLVAVCATSGGGATHPRRSAYDGPIGTWVWHFAPALREGTAASYADLLRALPARSHVFVAVAAQQDVEACLDTLGLLDRPDPRVGFFHVGRELSAWARDRYVVFSHGRSTYVLLPEESAVPESRRGDLDAGAVLAGQVRGAVLIRSRLDLEGGNVLLTDDLVLVGSGTVEDNAARLGGAEAVLREIERSFRRRAIVIGAGAPGTPHEHIDMFLSVVGPRRLLLGDPRWGARCAPPGGTAPEWTFERAAQEAAAPLYEAIADELTLEGFEVERIPILHSATGDLVTWNNAVTERSGGRRHVYLPAYGLRAADAEAAAVWRRLGFEVHPIRARGAIVEGGAVRCLTNELRTADEN